MKLEKAPPENAELLERLMTDLPGVERRKMFGYESCFVEGRLAFGLFADGLCMRLGPEDLEAALKIKGIEAFAPMAGRVMTGYVFVTRGALGDQARVRKWARKSVDFTRSLPPKKTTAGKKR